MSDDLVRMAKMEGELVEAEMAYAEAMALVHSHEGRIEKLEGQVESLGRTAFQAQEMAKEQCADAERWKTEANERMEAGFGSDAAKTERASAQHYCKRSGKSSRALDRARRALGLLTRNGDEWTRHQICGTAKDALEDIRAIMAEE